MQQGVANSMGMKIQMALETWMSLTIAFVLWADENSGERLSGHITFAASIPVSGVISTGGHLADTGLVAQGSLGDHNQSFQQGSPALRCWV